MSESDISFAAAVFVLLVVVRLSIEVLSNRAIVYWSLPTLSRTIIIVILIKNIAQFRKLFLEQDMHRFSD